MFFHKKQPRQPIIINENTIRKHIFFSGQVQGVGFRWEAKKNADTYRLTGWAQNLDDGRVECEIQGDLFRIQKWIKDFYSDPYINIESYTIEDSTVVPNEQYFTVRY